MIESVADLKNILKKAAEYERAGQKGFLLQEYIPTQGKTLRVVIIGRKFVSYWRIQKKKGRFYSSLAKGAVIDFNFDPDRQAAAVTSVTDFCQTTGINLAGFDLLFSSAPSADIKIQKPLFIEINYFFGRRGLGGSERYYELLQAEVEKWIMGLGLPTKKF